MSSVICSCSTSFGSVKFERFSHSPTRPPGKPAWLLLSIEGFDTGHQAVELGQADDVADAGVAERAEDRVDHLRLREDVLVV